MRSMVLFTGAAGVLAALLLVACATSTPQLTPQHHAERDALYARATAFWEAIVAKDNLRIAEFLEPEARDAFHMAQSFGGNAFNTIDFHIDAVEIAEDGEHAIVIVTQTFVASPLPNKRTVPGNVSRWRKIDGVWYREQEELPQIVSGSRRTNVRRKR